MFSTDQYELLDFGTGRKLERFGKLLLDRPSPAADFETRRHPTLWEKVDAQFHRQSDQRGVWKSASALPESWAIERQTSEPQRVVFEIKPTEFGHVGLFAEQAANWDWIEKQVRRAANLKNANTIKVLNLFAYTGGSTFAAAAAGAEVVHVDAAASVVAWARKNAELSGLTNAPIRWIVDDAMKFVQRELRRGSHYDAVILDPPSYGHGPKGEIWKLQRHLLPLLSACAELTKDSRAFMLLTCHSTGYGPAELQASLADAVHGHCQSGTVARELSIQTADGRKLPSGSVAFWSR